MNYVTVLGFETHIELNTRSKMFCGCSAAHFGVLPNTQVCPVCLGLPGALPVPNEAAIKSCLTLGLALNCQINLLSKFDRKNYFYPDLPKGYQISQYDLPFCYGGYLDLASGKRIGITRVHMEEDTGKLQHQDTAAGKTTTIDFNRSGVPLVEIVTEPEFNSADEALEFLKEIQLIVRALGISTADMEKGSMRLEANISVKPETLAGLPDYKVEIKNVNSFRFIKKAIEFEIIRQTELLKSGAKPVQETRGFSEAKGETFSQRRKESAHDYRYFPEPDIPPIEFTTADIDKLRAALPELPQATRTRLTKLGLSPSSVNTLCSSSDRLAKFAQLSKTTTDFKALGDLVANTPQENLDKLTYQTKTFITDHALILPLVTQAIAANPQAVADFKAGKTQAIFAILGAVRRDLPNVDVQLVQKLIQDQI